jgi:hypothetical protein
MRAKYRSETVDPIATKSNTDNAEARRPYDLSDIDEPKCVKSNTASAEPRRANLLIDIAEPTLTQSITDSLKTDPNRAKPISDTEEPMRIKLRTETDAPR